MSRPAPSVAPVAAPDRGRLVPYVAATALGSTAYIASFTVASLAAASMTGDARLAGLPSSLGTIGTAVAIGLLAALMARRGRRQGLLLGYVVAIAGAAASLGAIAGGLFPLLLAGSVAIGFGNAALQLSRYAAADLAPADRRAAAVGTVVWGSTAGAILGPNLLQPAGAAAEALGHPALQGGMAVTLIGFALTLLVTASWVRTAPAPRHGSDDESPGADVIEAEVVEAAAGGELGPAPVAVANVASGSGPGHLAAFSATRVQVAVIGLVASQVVMVLIMTMTPVHVHDMGEPLATVGLVISAHTLGMFALSPLSGRLVGRFGAVAVMGAGFAVLFLAAVLAAAARVGDIPVLALGLFLLGYGWNLAFVAGSGLLTGGASLAERIRLQGMTDVLVWVAGAAASLASGLLLEWAGFPALALLSGMLLAVPIVTLAVVRRRLAVAA